MELERAALETVKICGCREGGKGRGEGGAGAMDKSTNRTMCLISGGGRPQMHVEALSG
jgi:hypothetical protein